MKILLIEDGDRIAKFYTLRLAPSKAGAEIKQPFKISEKLTM